MRKIKLTRGKYALVDNEDYEVLNKLSWSLNSSGYAVTNIKIGDKKRQVKMHRMIMGEPPKLEIDHINRDRLDNRKINLRTVTRRQNVLNSVRRNKSGFKGVHWHKALKKWRSRIFVNNKYIHLGLFQDITVAANVYNEAAKKHFGEYARLNTI